MTTRTWTIRFQNNGVVSLEDDSWTPPETVRVVEYAAYERLIDLARRAVVQHEAMYGECPHDGDALNELEDFLANASQTATPESDS